MLAYHWLDWLIETQSLNIKHKLNSGKERKIGPYPVDGFDEETKTCYQLHGCFFHGHRCYLTKSQNRKENWDGVANKRAKKRRKLRSI